MKRPPDDDPSRRLVSRLGTIRALVDALSHPEGTVRQEAREALVSIGTAAVQPLLPVLWNGSSQARWEAAKILTAVPDAAASHALVRCLEDPDAGTRWVAAEALVALRLHAVRPLLHALAARGESLWLRRGAHHVLHDLRRANLLPPVVERVILALEGPAPEDGARWAAARVLDALDHEPARVRATRAVEATRAGAARPPSPPVS